MLLNHHLSQNLNLIRNGEVNHLLNILALLLGMRSNSPLINET
jgi:hypothetical protein